GGGSCMDLGKAVSYFLEQEAGTPGASYTDRPALLHVAVPTTYSGAELTPFFGVTDERTRAKSGGGGPTTAPVAVVYDPVLTLSTPARVSAETAMNALAHCVEVTYAARRSRYPHRGGRERRGPRRRGPAVSVERRRAVESSPRQRGRRPGHPRRRGVAGRSAASRRGPPNRCESVLRCQKRRISTHLAPK